MGKKRISIQENHSNVLCVFIKAPILGHVKTRLQPDLSEEKSLQFYKAMVEDLVDHFRSCPDFDVFLCFYPETEKNFIRKWMGAELSYLHQSGEDLGERMANTFSWCFLQGYQKAILIGSDLPDLDQSTILNGFDVLRNKDVVLGPSTDGGYYLIGMKKEQPDLFSNMAWSTSTVLDETRSRMVQKNILWAELALRTDLDTFETLENYFHNKNKAINQKAIPKTWKILEKIFIKRKR